VFSAKGCSGCHTEAAGAPSLALYKGSFSTISMISAARDDGPRMLDPMKQKDAISPRFTAAEISELIGYVATGSRAIDAHLTTRSHGRPGIA
jgi:hypothetical protein